MRGLGLFLILSPLSAASQSCGGKIRVGRVDGDYGSAQVYGDGDGDRTGGTGAAPIASGGASFEIDGTAGSAGAPEYGYGGVGFADGTDYSLGVAAQAISWDAVSGEGPNCEIPPICVSDPPMTCIGNCPPMMMWRSFGSGAPVTDLVATLDRGVALRTGPTDSAPAYLDPELRQFDADGTQVNKWGSSWLGEQGGLAVSGSGEMAAATVNAGKTLELASLGRQLAIDTRIPQFEYDDIVGLPEGGFLVTGAMGAGFLPGENIARSGPKTLWWGDEASGERVIAHRADIAGQMSRAGDRVFLQDQAQDPAVRSWTGNGWSEPIAIPFEATDDPDRYHTVFVIEDDRGSPLFMTCEVRRNTDERCRLSLVNVGEDNQVQAVHAVGELPLQLSHALSHSQLHNKVVVQGKVLLMNGGASCYQSAIAQLDLGTAAMDWAIVSTTDQFVITSDANLVIARTIERTGECEAAWKEHRYRVQLAWIGL